MCPYFLPQHTFPIRGKKKPIQFLHVYRALVTGYMNWCRVLIISGSSPWKYIRECNILVLSWRIYVHICLTVKICPVAIARVSNFQEEKWSTADGKKGEKSVEKPHTWCWAEESSGGRLEMGGTFTSLWWPSSFPGSLVVDSLSLPPFFPVVCTWEELWRSQVPFFLSSQPSEHFQVTPKHSGTVHQWNRVAAVLRMGPGRWWLGTPWWNSSASSAQKTTQNHEGTTPALRSSIFAYDCSWGLCQKIRILFDCWVFCFTKRSCWLSASSACICLFLLKQ